MSNGMVIQGRLLSSDDIDRVREIIVSNPSWRRTRISQELCNRWGWFNHLGQPKDMACRSMLLKLEAKGYITLPARSVFPSNGLQHRSIPDITLDTTPITASLSDLVPLAIEVVKGKDPSSLFCSLVSRYHYLGYRVTVGENMKYVIRDRFGRPLSCVLFGSSAWKVACRDDYVGWSRERRERNLCLVTNNMRFLVLPWVRVAHLASHVLGRIARRIEKDWVERYGHPVALLETFVDTSRFRGTCYRAANWRYVGQTKGRSRNDRYNDLRVPVKDVYLYPLTPHFRGILADERHCPFCHKKQEDINRLKDEIICLKDRLRHRERTEKEGFFGSSTPPSQKPVKANTQEKPKKPRGAKNGHEGFGRKSLAFSDADHVERVAGETEELCPVCGDPLEDKGDDHRSVLDSRPVKAEKIIYLLERKWCRRCRKTFRAEPPGVLPKNLYGNQLMANAAVMHYLHGIPVGRVCEQLGIGDGALLNIFHRMANLFSRIVPELIEQYRQSLVKHADETSWRTNGKNGYAWLFATTTMSIFLFKRTRSASVPREVFGEERLPGTLVVDRYNGYNKMPCNIQYCYSHLLREVQDIEKEFPDQNECLTFVASVAPLLALAIGLRRHPLSDDQFYQQAMEVKTQIKTLMESPSRHMAIRRIQDIFTQNEARLYHWTVNRDLPPENNLAERDLRPTVIARKVSFGSQSDGGAYSRGVLMTVMHTLKKRGVDVAVCLKYTLDQLAKDISMNPFDLLFTRPP